MPGDILEASVSTGFAGSADFKTGMAFAAVEAFAFVGVVLGSVGEATLFFNGDFAVFGLTGLGELDFEADFEAVGVFILHL